MNHKPRRPPSPHKKRRRRKPSSRSIAQLYDLIFKSLIRLSPAAVIGIINGLFGTAYPPDSSVEYPNVETVSPKLRRLLCDTIVIVNHVHAYHLEAEIADDENIAIRVFEYGYAEGLRTKTIAPDGTITLRLPDSIVIYWETTGKTPDQVTLRLVSADGTFHDHKVKTFKFLDHTIEELEALNLTPLLPLYMLKLRRAAARARTPEERTALAAELRALVEEVVRTTARNAGRGWMDTVDFGTVMEHLDTLIKELYSPYDWLEEADMALRRQVKLTWGNEFLEAKKAWGNELLEAKKAWDNELLEKEKQAQEAARRQFVELLKSGKTPEELIAMYSEAPPPGA